jgi:hypothetical protein
MIILGFYIFIIQKPRFMINIEIISTLL